MQLYRPATKKTQNYPKPHVMTIQITRNIRKEINSTFQGVGDV